MTSIRAVNLALEIFGIIISFIIICCMAVDENRKNRLNRLFIGMLVINIGVLLSDAITMTLSGRPSPMGSALTRVANVFVYSLGYLIVAVYTDYLVTFISRKTRISRAIVYVISALCAVAIVLVLISQVNHMYYHFDENNIYHRGPVYWLSQVWAIVIMLVNACIVILYRKSLSLREIFALLSYEVLPVISMVIQIYVYGLTLLYISTTLSLFIIYVSVQVEQARLLRQREQELTENRVAIMLSQIQPHFLYNSLVVIKQLCDIDPKEAKGAITAFSGYLRNNLDSITRKEPIPFAKELEHVRTYLALEQKRFDDKVRIVYDIAADGFLLPALTLQPIVENAVHHGVTRREEGGTVTIRTEEAPEAWRIHVTDDGVGFDPALPPRPDGRSHVGIENVRNRLHAMCGGTLTIDSAPGQGTTAVLNIPRPDVSTK